MTLYARSNTDVLLDVAERFKMSPIIFLKLDRKARTVTDELTGRIVDLNEEWNLT